MQEVLSKQINNFNDFKYACNHFGIEINNYQLDTFKSYSEILIKWNEKINLVSRKMLNDEEKRDNFIIERNFLDSIIFLPEIDTILQKKSLQTSHVRICDIGSGGGFPAIPLAIMKPEWDFTLCESIGKKCDFLNSLVQNLKLQNIKILNNRIENLNKEKNYKHKYNFITSRAVAKLDEVIKYSLPLINPNGYIVAYKAKDINEEINIIKPLINKNNLNLKVFSKVINDVERKLVCLSKK